MSRSRRPPARSRAPCCPAAPRRDRRVREARRRSRNRRSADETTPRGSRRRGGSTSSRRAARMRRSRGTRGSKDRRPKPERRGVQGSVVRRIERPPGEDAIDDLTEGLDAKAARQHVVQRRDRLAEEDGVVRASRICGDQASPSDLEVEPLVRVRCGSGQPPRSTRGCVALADVGNSHAPSLVRCGTIRPSEERHATAATPVQRGHGRAPIPARPHRRRADGRQRRRPDDVRARLAVVVRHQAHLRRRELASSTT